MIIAKAENGNVELRDDAGNAYEVMQPNARLQKDSSRQIIKIIYAQNNIVTIPFSEVNYTQLEPAAAVAFTGTLQELFDELKDNFFFFDGSSVTYPAGVEVITDNYTAETTTGVGDSMVIYTIDTSINQVIYVRAQAQCSKSGVNGHAVRFAGRAFSVDSATIRLSASTSPDSAITTTFNTPTLAISTSGNNLVIQANNGVQDTSWFIEYTVTIFELP